MSIEHYELLIGEIDNIVAAVKKFPEQAQGAACSNLMSALVMEIESSKYDVAGQVGHAASSPDSADVRDLEWYADNFNLKSMSNPKFLAFISCYHCELAPDGERLDAIDEQALTTAYDIADREIPTSLTQILSNTKNRNRYIESNSEGKLTPAPRGRRFVREFLKGKRN